MTILGFVFHTNRSVALEEKECIMVEIHSGDTLWDIACTYKSHDIETRYAVEILKNVNDVEPSNVKPGMVIKVPEDL